MVLPILALLKQPGVGSNKLSDSFRHSRLLVCQLPVAFRSFMLSVFCLHTRSFRASAATLIYLITRLWALALTKEKIR